ncbi:VCBS repeat-containing protein [Desulfoluna sp.]|uniref:FG-GAP repeat domain-containing protein n=1 Tax=Desulfoluna sp. TaxID=2045199 RepID=UPI00262DB8C3|nr:VCBS repeat-containing protein [Desulfoluna sp.]
MPLILFAFMILSFGISAEAEAMGKTGDSCAPFESFTELAYPLVEKALGRNLAPVAADLDGDGRPELYVGAYGQRMVALAADERPAYRTVDSNPLDAVTMSYETDTPFVALADIDNDGDNDAIWFDFRPADNRISSVYYNQMVYLKNDGTPTVPKFQMVPDDENPFAGISSEWQGTPAFGDFDGDGDLDLLFGDRSGTFRYCRNLLIEEGISVYAEMMGRLNPFSGIDVGDNSSPAVLDLDGDGDLDVVSGELRGGLRWIENTSSPGGPVAFVLRAPADSPFGAFSVGLASMPAIMDVDGDTDPDLVVGSSDGHLKILANPRCQPEAPSLVALEPEIPAEPGLQEDPSSDKAVDLSDVLVALKMLGEALVNALGPEVAEGAMVDGE